MKLQTKNALKGFSLILPLLLGCLVFYGLPFLLVVWYSLFQGGRFTALDTYIRLLENEVFRIALKNTFGFLAVGFAGALPLAGALGGGAV